VRTELALLPVASATAKAQVRVTATWLAPSPVAPSMDSAVRRVDAARGFVRGTWWFAVVGWLEREVRHEGSSVSLAL
jgi:hypothetical protein